MRRWRVVHRMHQSTLPHSPTSDGAVTELREVDGDMPAQAFAELNAKPTAGRAEAFRISMRNLIEKGTLGLAPGPIWPRSRPPTCR